MLKRFFSKGDKSKEQDGRMLTVNSKGSGGAASATGSTASLAPTGSGTATLMRRPRKVLSQPIEKLNEVLYRDAGTVMDRVSPGLRRPQEVCVVFNPSTFVISIFAGSTKGRPGTHIDQVDVSEIREVRSGTQAINTKDFKLGLDEPQPEWEPFAICVLYGMEFRLKQLCLFARSQDELRAWTEGLSWHIMCENPLLYDFPFVLPRWIEKHFQALDRQLKQSINMKDVRVWLQRVNCKLSPRDIKDNFQMVDRLKQACIGIEEMTELYHILVDVAVLTNEFSRFSSTKSIMTPEDLLKFFHEQQGERHVTLAECKALIEQYSTPGRPFRVSTFVEFLHSKRNEIFNPRHYEIHQDMTQPLAHYFIASSHNTYLMGDQWRSESSVEAYIRALRDGCRCIEIDTWDGPLNEPIVYHGLTLTSKIKFKDVLIAIRDHAFETSEMPVILSMENHCSFQQQDVMADLFKSIFGPMLITEPLAPNAQQYPSPLELKRRIIIKHKKIGSEGNSSSKGDDISSSIMNGCLYLEDQIDHTWRKHYFVLTDKSLSYMEAQDDEPERADDRPMDDEKWELHYGEPWFHGDIPSDVAAQLLMANNKGDGTFLVRQSKTRGGFAISYLFGGKVQHALITVKDGVYAVTDKATFSSLFELVEYFRRTPLRVQGYDVLLSEPVQPPAAHEGKKWFHPTLSRADAVDWLTRIRSDGAFLVRGSESDKDSFAISFRAEGKVKHCRIRKEGRMYCIGDTEFDSLVKLVEYYERDPLYRKMRLRYPVDEELVHSQGVEVEEDIYSCQELYQQPNAVLAQERDRKKQLDTITCKAIHSYAAHGPNELSFPKDAIINNVVKTEGRETGWWQGEYGGRVGMVPSNFVQEIELDEMMKEEKLEEENNPLGMLLKGEMNVRHLEVKLRPSTKDMRFIFRIQSSLHAREGIDVGVESEEERTEWMTAIARAVEMQTKATSKEQELQKKSGISKSLSDLIFYSQSVSFPGFDKCNNPNDYHKMSSFAEKKALTLCKQNAVEFNLYHHRQLSRVYPNGKRVDSSNYSPQPMWNAGCQLVALNYQHYDDPLWLNHGRFLTNGRCGYVLKHHQQRSGHFDPFLVSQYGQDPLKLKLKIISGRHLVKPKGGVASPMVLVEVLGAAEDNNSFMTRIAPDNGLCPVWNEETDFTIHLPDLACLRFVVQDQDVFGDPNTIAQACLPVGSKDDLSIRPGYRSVPLKNIYNEPLELSSLLVHVEYFFTPIDEKYQSAQQVKAELRRQREARETMIRSCVAAGVRDSEKTAELNKLTQSVLELEQQVFADESSKMATMDKARTAGKGKGKK